MSGTDHANGTQIGPCPSIILVRPQMGENIGAAARAMWNFGLHRLRLVAPRDGWPNQKAVAMASGASTVLDATQLFDDTETAIGDTHYLFATTARARDLTKPVLSPAAAMQRAHEYVAAGQQVGLLFGPERAGLENDDLAYADALIHIPTNPAFASLNLAQSVLLLAYEWHMAAGQRQVEDVPEWAGKGENARFTSHLIEALDARGFFFPDNKRSSMQLNLKNLFGRLQLTQSDVRTLYGIVKSLQKPRR